MEFSRKVAPFDPLMARDAISHYEFIAGNLREMADEMAAQADEFHTRAIEAKLQAERLQQLLEEFPDGQGTEQFDGEADG